MTRQYIVPGYPVPGWISETGVRDEVAPTGFLAENQPATAVTWNPSDIGTGMTLSNGNLTINNVNGTARIGRATLGRTDTTGKFFYTIQTAGSNSNEYAGFANSTTALSGAALGSDTNSIGFSFSGQIAYNTGSGGTSTGTTWSVGDTLGCEWNAATGEVKFYKLISGAFSLISAATTTTTINSGGAAVFPAVYDSSDSLTANFGATTIAALPAGTSSWDGSQVGAAAGVGSAAGSNTATGVGAWLQSGVGSSAGTNTVAGVGSWLQSCVGSSAGANTATGIGAELQAGVGSSAGTNTATATGHWLQSGVGSSAGDNTATAVGHWLQSGVGSSVGTDIAAGISSAVIATGAGLSIGANIAAGIGAWLQTATGTAVGGNIAQGLGPASDFNFDYDASFGGYPGADTGLGQGDFNNDFNDDFSVFSTGNIVSGRGESVGGNIALGVGSSVVFIPPVYPPPPPIPVQLWHPAQEYHRVQAPRATRIYKRGTELQRRPPQGMKRRYG